MGAAGRVERLRDHVPLVDELDLRPADVVHQGAGRRHQARGVLALGAETLEQAGAFEREAEALRVSAEDVEVVFVDVATGVVVVGVQEPDDTAGRHDRRGDVGACAEAVDERPEGARVGRRVEQLHAPAPAQHLRLEQHVLQRQVHAVRELEQLRRPGRVLRDVHADTHELGAGHAEHHGAVEAERAAQLGGGGVDELAAGLHRAQARERLLDVAQSAAVGHRCLPHEPTLPRERSPRSTFGGVVLSRRS